MAAQTDVAVVLVEKASGEVGTVGRLCATDALAAVLAGAPVVSRNDTIVTIRRRMAGWDGWAEVAAVGGMAFPVLDGAAYGPEFTGEDAATEEVEDFTFPARRLAMIATLPDSAWNIGKVSAEYEKIGAKTVVARRKFPAF